MEKPKPLIRGECPICHKTLMDKTKTKYINGGMEFFVLFNDNSRASFAMCEDCYSKITQEQLDEIMKSQIVCWGIEIWRQMQWYYESAVHLRIMKHAKTKKELESGL